jgi:predicted nucleic acid-binding protein
MSRYLLDTTALIDFSKGREPARSRILGWIAGGDDVGVCAVNVAEFYSGLAPRDHAVWDAFFGALAYWDVTRTVSRQAGVWRYVFARQGTQLSTADTLVAAVAQEQAAIVVTNNVKDYPMAGVQVMSP